jgi:pyridoxamine 5'-phosphate oxidase
LERRVEEIEKRFADQQIPCPEHWGGFRVTPLSLEFWQAQEFRLHDRMKFTRENPSAPWQSQRLAP